MAGTLGGDNAESAEVDVEAQGGSVEGNCWVSGTLAEGTEWDLLDLWCLFLSFRDLRTQLVVVGSVLSEVEPFVAISLFSADEVVSVW